MDDAIHSRPNRVGHHLLVGALAAVATLGTTDATAALDQFAKIGDIKGESQDDKHKDEVDVLTWSWGVSGPTAASPKTAPQAACTQTLSITKNVDKATAPLMQNAALNTPVASAKLTVRKAGDRPLEFLVVELSNVTVKAVTLEGSRDADSVKEQVTLAFSSAKITYTPQRPDGTGDAPLSANLPASCP